MNDLMFLLVFPRNLQHVDDKIKPSQFPEFLVSELKLVWLNPNFGLASPQVHTIKQLIFIQGGRAGHI